MNETPPQTPFSSSTQDPAPPSPVENASPATANAELLAAIVPAALIFGGFAGCALLWILSRGDLVMRIAGIIVLLSDLAVAAFLRHIFLKRLPAHRNSDKP